VSPLRRGRLTRRRAPRDMTEEAGFTAPSWRIAIVVLALTIGQAALPTRRSGPKTCRSKDPTTVVSSSRGRVRAAAWRRS
jgi:hypothetical protein